MKNLFGTPTTRDGAVTRSISFTRDSLYKLDMIAQNCNINRSTTIRLMIDRIYKEMMEEDEL